MQKLMSLMTCALLAWVAMPSPTFAAPPQTINYQGSLTNAGGTPINGAVSMTFRIYNEASGVAAALWSETQMSVNVTNGAFNTLLGALPAPPVTLAFDVPYWLSVQVNADAEMTPRQPFSSVPYAYRATSLEPGATVSAANLTSTGNIVFANPSGPGVGNIVKNGNRFIHNYGTGNTFIGELSGNFNMTGQNNTGSGFWALRSLSSGNANTASGASTLSGNTTGSSNTATGTFALESNTTGSMNTATGVDALQKNISGNNNTANGVQALFTNFGGNDNTASGAFALQNNFFGSKNTATGSLALRNNTSGNVNTAMGWNALGSNTTGFRNTAIGESAMFGNTTGNDNTASGISALAVNTSGAGNTASGSGALLLNTTGGNNTANGSAALVFNVVGNENTAIGKGALYISGRSDTAGAFALGGSYTIQSVGNTNFTLIGAADNNVGTVFVATGVGAGTGTATGNANNNIAIGANAGGAITTGSSNIIIGAPAGGNITTGNNNIVIGNSAQLGDSGTIRIGDSNVALRTFIAGILGATVAGGTNVLINGAGQLGTTLSSRRYKDDIANMDQASSALMALRPVTFHYKTDQSAPGRTLQYGLIAEEVAEIYPGLIAHSTDGQIETVMYQYLPPMLLNEFQKQQRTIDAQATELASQRAALVLLAHEVRELKARREADLK